MDNVNILGIRIDKVTMAETLKHIETFMAEPWLHQICTVNPEFVMKAQEDVVFREVLESAELNIPDGIGLIYASRWQGNPLPERVAGSDLVYHVAELCALRGWRLFLLGSAEGIALSASIILQHKYEGLTIAGTYSGSPTIEENASIVKRINASRADVLYVAYGAPNQDKWIARNRDSLKTVRVAVGVGGSLDFITGYVSRAPRWVQKIHLEWLYRLLRQPSRWRRILILPRFVWRIIWKG